MRRREFIKAVAGLPGLFPLTVAAAQQAVRHIGILVNGLEDDPEIISRIAALWRHKFIIRMASSV